MADLILNLKTEYFVQIAIGTKTEEFRLVNDYWRKRLVGKTYQNVVICKGYPKRGDNNRRIVFPWNGYRIIKFTHPHFGSGEVEVFAIKLSPE